MRTFDYHALPARLLASDITNQLLTLRELKGRQVLLQTTRAATLGALQEHARIQSTGASNRIEGIVTTEKRLHGLVARSLAPQNRAEEEIAGYRDVLGLIHEQHDGIIVSPSVILQLHRDLMAHTSASYGGRWKDSDNEIVSRDADGNTFVRFHPVSAFMTPQAVEELCEAYNAALGEHAYDPLLLSLCFVFDFVCIHPFTDGNGRMSRLLTVLLLERCGYEVPRYVSIERLIEDNKDLYYEALAASSTGWMENENDYAPFVRYLLGTVTAAYRQLFDLVEDAQTARPHTKAERVGKVFARKVGKVTKQDVREECPDISDSTIERELKRLLDEGRIEKVGGGRSSGYVWRDGAQYRI